MHGIEASCNISASDPSTVPSKTLHLGPEPLPTLSLNPIPYAQHPKPKTEHPMLPPSFEMMATEASANPGFQGLVVPGHVLAILLGETGGGAWSHLGGGDLTGGQAYYTSSGWN